MERQRASRGTWAVRGCAALVVLYYLWSASSSGNAFSFGAENRDYYNLLVDGLFAGRLSLPVAPDPGLLALADPYDPVANLPYRVPRQTHDLSLFQQRFYLYFGVAPALALFAPARALGARLPENLAAALLLAAGFLGSLAIFERWLRRFYPAAPLASRLLAVVVLGFGAFAPYLLRRPVVYEVAIGGGYCFAAWGVYALLRGALDGPKRSWLALAGLLLGLAVGSRPIQVVTVLVALAVLSRLRRGALAFLVPLAAVAGMLGAYNYARFGSFTEFGIRYQLTEWNQHRDALFSFSYLWPGLRFNLLFPPRLQPEFPFFALDPSPLPPMPRGHFGVEPIAGLLACAPIAVLGLAWPWLLHRRRRLGLGAQPAVIACGVLTLGMLLAAAVSMYGVVSVRYVVDFGPWLLLAGLCAAAELDAALAPGPRRLALRLAVVALAAYTTLLNGAVGLTGYTDWMKRGNPPAYQRLEELGLPVQRLWLALMPEVAGPIRLEVALPEQQETAWQALLAAGGLYRHDVVCIRRLAGDRFLLRFHHRGFEPIRSRPLPVPSDGKVSAEIEMGSLYPVNARVLSRLFADGQAAEKAGRIRVRVEGQDVLAGEFDFVPSPPRLVSLGFDSFANGQCDDRFGGRILRATRLLPGQDR